MHRYKTTGTCSTEIRFELRGGKVHNVSFERGCNGNLKALGVLAEGMNAAELARKLRGLTCGTKQTSCADQLALAVAAAVASGAETNE